MWSGRILLVCALMSAHAGMALAEDCKPSLSRADDFGVAELGKVSPAKLDALVTRTDSALPEDESCGWLDKNGIVYSWIEDYLEQKIVVVSDIPISAGLPFGLHRDDAAQTIADKIKQRYGIPLETGQIPVVWGQFPVNNQNDAGTVFASSGLCLKNRNGEIFDLWLTFNKDGALQKFGTRIENPRD